MRLTIPALPISVDAMPIFRGDYQVGQRAWIAVVTADGYFMAMAESGANDYVLVKEPERGFGSWGEARAQANRLNAANGLTPAAANAILDGVMRARAFL